MKLYITVFLILLTLLGCGTSKTSVSIVSTPDPLTQLRRNINYILSDSLFLPARTGIKVVSLMNGEVLYEHDSKALMNPASNIKLLTSAAALSVLDTSYRFLTSVFVDNNFADGIVDGNIYLKGYGDPNLTTADLDSLAYAVRGFGIVTITRNIIVDDSYFDDNYWGAGWTWDDESDPDAPYINALSVNSNCIKVNALSDSSSTFIYLEPMTAFVTVINKAKVSDNLFRTPLKIKRLSLNNPNTIIIEGELPRFGQVTKVLALRQPEYYVGTLFKESLRHAGVIVYGDVVNGTVPNRLRAIAQHTQPIEKIITNLNKVSDNLSAENTLKVLGAVKNGVPGSAKNGVSVIKRFLYTIGMDTTQFNIADGSGVSRYNLLSSDQLVWLLAEIYKQQKIFPLFYNSLPIAGVDGTLAERMRTYPVACNLRAKTGTLNGVSCLSGYVQTRDGEMLAFSIMMQNYITSSSYYRQVQDRIGALLSGFSRYALVQQEINNETVIK